MKPEKRGISDMFWDLMLGNEEFAKSMLDLDIDELYALCHAYSIPDRSRDFGEHRLYNTFTMCMVASKKTYSDLTLSFLRGLYERSRQSTEKGKKEFRKAEKSLNIAVCKKGNYCRRREELSDIIRLMDFLVGAISVSLSISYGLAYIFSTILVKRGLDRFCECKR